MLFDTLWCALRAVRGKRWRLPWGRCNDRPGCRPLFLPAPVIRASPLCVLWFRNCAPGIRRPRFCSLNDRLARRPQANPCAVWAVVAGIPPASRLLLRRPQRFQCPDLDCSWQSVLREGLLSPLPHVKGELHLLGVMSCGVHSEMCPKY